MNLRALWHRWGTGALLAAAVSFAFLVLTIVFIFMGRNSIQLALASFAILIASLQLLQASFVVRENRRNAMRDRYTQLIPERGLFWDFIRCAFKAFQGTTAGQPWSSLDLMHAVRAAGLPPKFNKFADGKNFINDYVFPEDGANTDQRALWHFTETLYPQSTQNNKALLDAMASNLAATNTRSVAFEDFNEARSKLGDFWEVWCGNDEHYEGMGLNYVCSHHSYRKEMPQMVLLTYLDIHHRKRTGDKHVGKIPMYRAANRLHSTETDRNR